MRKGGGEWLTHAVRSGLQEDSGWSRRLQPLDYQREVLPAYRCTDGSGWETISHDLSERERRRPPLHLHRHSFELTKVYGKPTSGILKDTVVVNASKIVEVDFTADNPGNTLFHCHQQLHMDFGFMALLKYV